MSRTVPGDARREWPRDEGRDQYGEGQDVAGSGYSDKNGAPSGYDAQGYGGEAYDGQGYDGQGYDGQGYDGQGYDGQGYAGQGYDGQGYAGQEYSGPGYDQGYAGQQGYQDQAYGQGYPAQPFGGTDQGYSQSPTRQYEEYPGQQTRRYDGYGDQQAGPGQRYDGQGNAWQGNYRDQGYTGQPGYQGQAGGQPGIAPGGGRRRRSGDPSQRTVRFRRLRRFARRPTVRVIAAIFAVFLAWVMFSAGQAAFKNNGQGFTANLAEWARDHYLGPVVTFGEWLSYNPPKTGGKPGFSYAVPKGEQITNGKHHKGFIPDIPPGMKSLASGTPLSGEGQWRVVEKVKGEPAILITFLRDATYTSYSSGIASIDQRLVKFSLRPGAEDPGAGDWGVPDYIPAGQRTGVLATFNGGFKLDAAQGGFYLNGNYHGSLINGAASIVYYKNGTIKIGQWGRDFHMNSKIEGVRQNLKLIIDRGKVSPNLNQDIETKFGATLGGGYYVWRSGIGITRDNRIVFVYGQALNVQDLAELLQRAGAVEGMQMDINPEWMKFDYYKANGHPGDPTPMPLLPTQQASPESYYTPSTRDFTAVYAR